MPFEGSWLAFFLGFNLFIVVNLALGFLISTVARNQMQAMQLIVLHHPALDPALGLHVPVRRHAGLGAVPRQRRAGDAFPPRRPHGDAEGRRASATSAARCRALTIILVVISLVAMLRYRQTLD